MGGSLRRLCRGVIAIVALLSHTSALALAEVDRCADVAALAAAALVVANAGPGQTAGSTSSPDCLCGCHCPCVTAVAVLCSPGDLRVGVTVAGSPRSPSFELPPDPGSELRLRPPLA